MDVKCNCMYPYRRETEVVLTQTHGRKDDVNMETMTELMGLQAKESQEMPGSHQKLEDAKNGFPPQPLEKVQPCWHADFRLLPS